MKPNIFDIFRTFSRYLEKNWEFSETCSAILRDICI